ncbi:MAG: zinc ribbon domain-containing protein [Clostridiales bacterium]|nr:zinc ribbon domain-containing protein [Clostridiales bacterium]
MQCPNCGAQIKRFELDQNCSHCGINIFYSQQGKLLSDDAKNCELEYASFRLFTERLKTAFIKGKLQIMRIVLTVLCVVSVLVPFASLKIAVPLFEKKISFGGIGIFNGFSDGSLAAIFNSMQIEAFKRVADMAVVLLASMVLIVLCALVLFASELLSFINIRRSTRAMAIVSGAGIAAALLSVICSVLFALSDASFSGGALRVSFGFGGIVCAVMFAAMLFLNLTMIKRKVAPDYKQVDLERVELRKKLKRGEITLEELPLPIFDSFGENAEAQGGADNG